MIDSSFKVYGIPYMGNKAGIARDIFNFISSRHNAGTLVEPFCGGFSVGSTFLRNGWNVVANDYNKYTWALLKKVTTEGLPLDVYEWVTREHFNDVKTNPDRYEDWYVGYIGQIWSFGTRGINGSYLFGKHLEETKRLGHLTVTAESVRKRRLHLKMLLRHLTEKENAIPEQSKDGVMLQQLERLERLERLQQLEQLQQLERLEQLERLQQLEQLEQLELHNKDYRDLVIPTNAVVYCDPPYQGTATYKDEIDYVAFWQWVRGLSQTNPVYVSSYEAPDDMTCVWSKEKLETLSNRPKRKIKIEKIYTYSAG